MKLLLILLIIALTETGLQASENIDPKSIPDGLLIHDKQVPPNVEVRDGETHEIYRIEVIKPTRTALRIDAKINQRYWIELEFPKPVEPKETSYFFNVGGKQLAGFVLLRITKDSAIWALECNDLSRGRLIFKSIVKAFELSSTNVEDETNSDQGGADQHATAPELKSEGKDKPQPESKFAPR